MPHTDTSRREKEFVHTVQIHRPALLAYTKGLLAGDVLRAEDVVQEVFIRAWQWFDRLVTEPLALKRWLRQVAHNIVIDGHRMRSARPAEVDLDDVDVVAPTDATAHVLRSLVLTQMLDSVRSEHRAVLVEVYLNDRTVPQTAEVLGIPAGTVKSRVHHGLHSLRAALAEHSSDLLAG